MLTAMASTIDVRDRQSHRAKGLHGTDFMAALSRAFQDLDVTRGGGEEVEASEDDGGPGHEQPSALLASEDDGGPGHEQPGTASATDEDGGPGAEQGAGRPADPGSRQDA